MDNSSISVLIPSAVKEVKEESTSEVLRKNMVDLSSLSKTNTLCSIQNGFYITNFSQKLFMK